MSDNTTSEYIDGVPQPPRQRPKAPEPHFVPQPPPRPPESEPHFVPQPPPGPPEPEPHVPQPPPQPPNPEAPPDPDPPEEKSPPGEGEATQANSEGQSVGGDTNNVKPGTPGIEATCLRALMLPEFAKTDGEKFGPQPVPLPGTKYPIDLGSPLGNPMYYLCQAVGIAGGPQSVSKTWVIDHLARVGDGKIPIVGEAEIKQILAAWMALGTPCAADAQIAGAEGMKWTAAKMADNLQKQFGLKVAEKRDAQAEAATMADLVSRYQGGSAETFVDIKTAWEAGITQTLPSVAALDGKTSLLYAGTANVFYGPPGGGKTLVAILAMYSAMKEGHEVVFLDYENGHKTVLYRFSSMGCDMSIVLAKLKYVEFPDPSKVKIAQAWVKDRSAGLAVIDSVAKSIGAAGLNEDLASDFMTWSTSNVQPFIATGASVLMLDHTIKSVGENGGFARGSGSKKGDVGGSMLEFVTGEPFAPATPYKPGKAGYVKLVIRKDREGGLGAEGEPVGIVKFSPAPEGKTRWEFVAESSVWRINTAHIAILEALAADPGCTRTRLKELIREGGGTAANGTFPRLLGELKARGYAEEDRGGKNGAYRLTITEAGKGVLA